MIKLIDIDMIRTTNNKKINMNNKINHLQNGDFEVKKESVVKYLSTRIGGTSLIGVMGDPPYSHGNYFWLSDGPRIVNFWAENLEDADERFDLGGKIRVRIYTEDRVSYGLIEDDRIDPEWYTKKLCFTGTYRPSLEIVKDMYSRIGDPDNNLEEYTDPVSYHKKRGNDYDPATGRITYHVNAVPRRLSANWKLDIEDINQIDEDVEDVLTKTLMQSLTEG